MIKIKTINEIDLFSSIGIKSSKLDKPWTNEEIKLLSDCLKISRLVDDEVLNVYIGKYENESDNVSTVFCKDCTTNEANVRIVCMNKEGKKYDVFFCNSCVEVEVDDLVNKFLNKLNFIVNKLKGDIEGSYTKDLQASIPK